MPLQSQQQKRIFNFSSQTNCLLLKQQRMYFQRNRTLITHIYYYFTSLDPKKEKKLFLSQINQPNVNYHKTCIPTNSSRKYLHQLSQSIYFNLTRMSKHDQASSLKLPLQIKKMSRAHNQMSDGMRRRPNL